MPKDLIAKAEITINAQLAKVWEALTKPELIKQYLFGTEAESDWKAGSQIRYRGEWQGKKYEDKGEVLKAEPEKLLVTTYWSSMSGLPDVPENYNVVTYELSAAGDSTKLTITQDNNPSESSRDHSRQNWEKVLEGIKKLVEKPL